MSVYLSSIRPETIHFMRFKVADYEMASLLDEEDGADVFVLSVLMLKFLQNV